MERKNVSTSFVSYAIIFFLSLLQSQVTVAQEIKKCEGIQNAHAHSIEAEVATLLETEKKKVLILLSSSGGGHVSAANAVEGSLDPNKYQVVKLDILKDKIPGEGMFDELFNQEAWFKLKMTVSMMFMAEQMVNIFHKAEIGRIIRKEKPDIIISVFPVANFVYRSIGSSINVPMLVIPTDLNPTMFVNNIYSETRSFQINFPVEDKRISRQLKRRGIKNQSKFGYPIRNEMEKLALRYRHQDPSFIEEMNKFKQEQNIGAYDKVMLISMGAKSFGQATIEQYVDTLIKENEQVMEGKEGKLHLYVATGSNKNLFEKINKKIDEIKEKNLKIEIHPEGWMNATQMGLRIAVSDLLLIKPGGSTVGEALAFGKKMLIKSDSTQALEWEEYNMNYILKKGWGEKLNFTTATGIDKNDFLTKVKAGIEGSSQIDSPENHFSQSVAESVETLINQSAKRKRRLEREVMRLKKEKERQLAAQNISK